MFQWSVIRVNVTVFFFNVKKPLTCTLANEYPSSDEFGWLVVLDLTAL